MYRCLLSLHHRRACCHLQDPHNIHYRCCPNWKFQDLKYWVCCYPALPDWLLPAARLLPLRPALLLLLLLPFWRLPPPPGAALPVPEAWNCITQSAAGIHPPFHLPAESADRNRKRLLSSPQEAAPETPAGIPAHLSSPAGLPSLSPADSAAH